MSIKGYEQIEINVRDLLVHRSIHGHTEYHLVLRVYDDAPYRNMNNDEVIPRRIVTWNSFRGCEQEFHNRTWQVRVKANMTTLHKADK